MQYKELWEVTTWCSRCKEVDKNKQKNIIKYKKIDAKTIKDISVEGGDIRILSTGKYIGYTTHEKASNYINQGEVVAIADGGGVNIQYCKGLFATSYHNKIITSIDKNILDNKFLYYFLMNKKNEISSLYVGTTIKHLHARKIFNYKIPIHSIEKQKQTVKILDSLNNDLNFIDECIEFNKKKYKYYLNELLGFSSE